MIIYAAERFTTKREEQYERIALACIKARTTKIISDYQRIMQLHQKDRLAALFNVPLTEGI